MIDVCLLGTGGMYPLPDRALTSLYVRYGSSALLIDCGEGTQTAIRSAGLRFKSIEGILITHFHADHVSGLPGLLLTMGNEGRDMPLHMYGPRGLKVIVNSMRVIVPELPFDIEFHEIDTSACVRFACAGLNIEAFPAKHSIPCVGYGVELSRTGKFDPKRAREKGIPVQMWGRLQKGECVDGYSPEDVLGPSRRGLRFVYATDTRPVPGIERCGQNADLLILEGMFGEADKEERAEISGHMMMQEAAQIASRVGAKRLWLTHYSPATLNPQDFEEELKAIFPDTTMGTDGLRCILRFDD